MRQILFIFVAILPAGFSWSQSLTLDWAKNFEGTGTGYPKNIKQSSSNDYIIAGNFNGPVDFDPTNGVNIHSPSGSSDIFFGKYDQNGNLMFLNTIGGIGQDNIYQMITDQNDNIYLLGNFDGTVDFDPSPGTYNLTSYLFFGAFIAKYNSAGDLMYAKSFYSPTPASSTLYIYDAKIDQNSDLIITGDFENAVDFDHSTNSDILFGSEESGFFAKYNSNGDLLFARALLCNSSMGTTIHKLDLDPLNNIYLTGRFTTDTDFDPSSNTYTLTCAGDQDIFFAKYDPQGNLLFTKAINEVGDGGGSTCIKLDLLGNIYVSCFFLSTSSIDFDPSSSASFLYNVPPTSYYVGSISKYDNSGNFVYALTFETDNVDNIEIRHILFDANNKMYIGGMLLGTCHFPGTINTYNSFNSASDMFIAKYDDVGNFYFCETLPSNGNDYLHSFILDNSQNIVIGGGYEGICDFDPSPGVFSYTANVANGFFARYIPSTIGIENKTITPSSLYPNPFSDAVYLRNIPNNSTVQLISELGQPVYASTISGSGKISTSSLPPGCYIVEITSEGQTSRSKLIKY